MDLGEQQERGENLDDIEPMMKEAFIYGLMKRNHNKQ